MNKNQLSFLNCDNKKWFTKLNVFTQAKIMAQKDKITYKELGISYNEYEDLKNMDIREINS